MSMLLDLPQPSLQFLKGLGVIDCVEEVDCAYTAVKGPYNCAEKLLTSLNDFGSTVSQICNLTRVPPSTDTILEANYTPTVTLYCSEKHPLMYRVIRLDLPTPEYMQGYLGRPVQLS